MMFFGVLNAISTKLDEKVRINGVTDTADARYQQSLASY
jgi:hypothetical protein